MSGARVRDARYHQPRALAWCLVAAGVVGCEREQPQPADSAGARPASAVSAPTVRGDSPKTDGSAPTGAPQAVAINSACVNEGSWQSCSLERRLIDAGFVLINKGAAPTGVFPVPGTTYTLGAAELHVYLFASEKARETAIGGLDTVTMAPRGGVASFPTPHTLVTSNNLAAVLISDNGRLVERVQNAITAGLPPAAR